jgi:hypothetical protein
LFAINSALAFIVNLYIVLINKLAFIVNLYIVLINKNVLANKLMNKTYKNKK